MKKQKGMGALKLILIIALGILMAGFIGCVGSTIFTGAVITGIATSAATALQKQNTKVMPAPIYNAAKINEQRLQEKRKQLEMEQFVQQQKIIQANRPTDQPTQGYVEINGKRVAIPKHEPQAKSQELTREDWIEYKRKTGKY